MGEGRIVVSLSERLRVYSNIRILLKKVNIRMPYDLPNLHEYSLIMALTGITNSLDRNFIKLFIKK